MAGPLATVKAIIHNATQTGGGLVEFEAGREYTLDELWALAIAAGALPRVWTYEHNGLPRSVHVDLRWERGGMKAELRSRDYPPEQLAAALAEVLSDARLGGVARASR